jgi:hypothetical protein
VQHQPDPMFQNGAQLFQKLQQDYIQEYSRFKRLNQLYMSKELI